MRAVRSRVVSAGGDPRARGAASRRHACEAESRFVKDPIRGTVFEVRPCRSCGFLMGMGPAKTTSQVAVELRATMIGGSRLLTEEESRGWNDELRGADSSTLDSRSRQAGWLARRICMADHETWGMDSGDRVADIEVGSGEDVALTVCVDGDGDPAVQIDGISEAPPLLTPDEAEALADDLERGADAARQAAIDGYHGRAAVVALEVAAADADELARMRAIAGTILGDLRIRELEAARDRMRMGDRDAARLLEDHLDDLLRVARAAICARDRSFSWPETRDLYEAIRGWRL